MGKVCTLVLILFACCSITAAQGYPLQVYGGVQWASVDTHQVQDVFNLFHVENPTTPLINFGGHQNLTGWAFGGQGDANSWFGFVIDASGNYRTKKIDFGTVGGVDFVGRSTLRAYSFMGGPQFTLRRIPRVAPFARVLVGGVWYSDSKNLLENNVPQFAEQKESDSSFALGGGVGLDVSITRRVGLRLSSDYIRSYCFSDTQNNFRAMAGLVFKLQR